MANALRRDSEPGRIRWKLSEMLAEQGYTVSPYDLIPNNPQAIRYEDCATWFALGKRTADDAPVSICSWDTMTAIVRHGLVIDTSSPYADVEVHVQ